MYTQFVVGKVTEGCQQGMKLLIYHKVVTTANIHTVEPPTTDSPYYETSTMWTRSPESFPIVYCTL